MKTNKMTLNEVLAHKEPAPRKKPGDKEHQLQCACVRWFNIRYPRLRGRLFAVPNGGRRDAVTGARLKAEGVVAGVADLILLKSNRDYGALLIEMKHEKGKQTKAQQDWECNVCSHDEYKYVVCHNLDEFMREINNYISLTTDDF